MKKAIISLGAILFSGVLLASCSSTKTLSKPNKGKAVDSVSFKTDDGDIEIKKNDKYEDIVEKFDCYYLDIYSKDNAYGFESVETDKSNITEKNYVDTVYSGYSSKYAIFNSYTAKDTSSYYKNLYRKAVVNSDGTEITSYFESTSTETGEIKSDNYSEKYNNSEKEGYAGYEASNSTNYTVDAGKYEITKEKKKTSSFKSEDVDNTKNLYQYLDKTEKKSDPDFGSEYRGYDKNGESYSYRITSFCDDINANTGSFYHFFVVDTDGYDELYKASFELTDKYIILNIKLDYTTEMRSYAMKELEDDTSSKMVDKLKELRDKEFKGSYSQYEIWISYDMKSDDNSNIVVPTYVYYSSKEVNKYNIEKEITKDYLEKNNLDAEAYKSYIGKKYTKKGTDESSYQAKYNDKNYDSKIKSLKNKCKKNNIFDDLKMEKI